MAAATWPELTFTTFKLFKPFADKIANPPKSSSVNGICR